MRRRNALTGSTAELRYTFHWIYVGILDTVTTATIQLFGSHGCFVLIGAPWAHDRAISAAENADTDLSRASGTQVKSL